MRVMSVARKRAMMIQRTLLHGFAGQMVGENQLAVVGQW
jgi:hypothetical protein